MQCISQQPMPGVNCAQRFVPLPGGFEPPTYAETLASTLYLPVL